MIIRINPPERKVKILQALIQEYTETGEPVASKVIYRKYHLNISPATIRNDFKELNQKGFLYKPHISSGRIPTDKAWRFFIKSILEDELAFFQRREEKIIENIVRSQLAKIGFQPARFHYQLLNPLFIQKMVDILSSESRLFCFCYLSEKEEMIQRGFRYLFEGEIEESLSPDFIQKIIDSLESLNEKVKDIRIEKSPLVLIGKENYLIDSEEFSSILSYLSQPKAIIGMLGPKRMPYKRNIAILEAVSHFFCRE